MLASLEKIAELQSKMDISRLFEQQETRKMVIKAKNFMELSQLLLRAMLERKESRGAHYREDYPAENPAFSKRLFISRNPAGTLSLEFLDQ